MTKFLGNGLKFRKKHSAKNSHSGCFWGYANGYIRIVLEIVAPRYKISR
jgi:hypothetical protein